jgi:hypothetical protein
VIILVLTQLVDPKYLTNFDIMQNKMKLKNQYRFSIDQADPDETNVTRQVKNAPTSPPTPSNPN